MDYAHGIFRKAQNRIDLAGVSQGKHYLFWMQVDPNAETMIQNVKSFVWIQVGLIYPPAQRILERLLCQVHHVVGISFGITSFPERRCGLKHFWQPTKKGTVVSHPPSIPYGHYCPEMFRAILLAERMKQVKLFKCRPAYTSYRRFLTRNGLCAPANRSTSPSARTCTQYSICLDRLPHSPNPFTW